MKALTPGEKHTPIISLNGNNVKITVENHPAQSEEHFISNITLFQNGEILISKDLKPENEAVLETKIEVGENGLVDLYATEYCNQHGKWDSEGKFLGM